MNNNISTYICDNITCSLKNTLEKYAYEFGGVRPVCKECGEAPMLIPEKAGFTARVRNTTNPVKQN